MRFSLGIRTGKHVGREIPIEGPRFLIGCADNCHLKLNAGQVSLYHCALLVQDDGIWVRDYGGGTIVNGARIVDRRRLDHADRLEIGSLHFELLIHDAPVNRNARVADEGRIVDLLPQPVERPVARVPEQSDLSNARSESPKVPPSPLTRPTRHAEPVATAEVSDQSSARSESPKVVLPWYLKTPSNRAEPADVVADSLLKRFFVRKNAFGDQHSPRTITWKIDLMALWLKLFPADGLDPNVMFVLGILVGIGLSAAGLAFFSISGR